MKLRQSQAQVMRQEVSGLPALAGALPLPGAPDAQTQTLVATAGGWANFDFLIQAGPEWLDVTVQVIAQAGNVRWPVKTVALAELPRLLSNQYQLGVATPATSPFGVRAIGARGILCERIELRAFPTNADHGEATIVVVSSNAGSVLGDRSNQLVANLFADPTQQARTPTPAGCVVISAANGNVGIPVPLLPLNPNGGRVAMTRLSIETDNPDPQLVALESFNELAAFGRGCFLVGGAAGPRRVEPFSYPLRSEPRGDYRVTVPAVAGASQYVINATGYYE